MTAASVSVDINHHATIVPKFSFKKCRSDENNSQVIIFHQIDRCKLQNKLFPILFFKYTKSQLLELLMVIVCLTIWSKSSIFPHRTQWPLQ